MTKSDDQKSTTTTSLNPMSEVNSGTKVMTDDCDDNLMKRHYTEAIVHSEASIYQKSFLEASPNFENKCDGIPSSYKSTDQGGTNSGEWN